MAVKWLVVIVDFVGDSKDQASVSLVWLWNSLVG